MRRTESGFTYYIVLHLYKPLKWPKFRGLGLDSKPKTTNV